MRRLYPTQGNESVAAWRACIAFSRAAFAAAATTAERAAYRGQVCSAGYLSPTTTAAVSPAGSAAAATAACFLHIGDIESCRTA